MLMEQLFIGLMCPYKFILHQNTLHLTRELNRHWLAAGRNSPMSHSSSVKAFQRAISNTIRLSYLDLAIVRQLCDNLPELQVDGMGTLP